MASSRADFKMEVEWAQTAQLSAILVNANRDPKKSKGVSSSDMNPMVLAAKKLDARKLKVPITVLKRFAHGEERHSRRPRRR